MKRLVVLSLILGAAVVTLMVTSVPAEAQNTCWWCYQDKILLVPSKANCCKSGDALCRHFAENPQAFTEKFRNKTDCWALKQGFGSICKSNNHLCIVNPGATHTCPPLPPDPCPIFDPSCSPNLPQ